MDESLISQLEQLQGPFLLFTLPEVLDLVKGGDPNLVVMAKNGNLKISLKNNLFQVLTTLTNVIKGPVFWWDAKTFYSYVLYATGRKFNSSSMKILDLKVIESYIGKKNSMPMDHDELLRRAKLIRENDNWKEVYNKIHLPLIEDVVPSLENIGILDSQDRKVLRAYYEIEGQKHGRFKCLLKFSNGYNPHSLKPEEKKIFKPVGEDRRFLYLDFRHMEVSVLQWLSKDECLGKILNNSDDFYATLFKLITGRDCGNPKHREFCKGSFLPVVFGMSSATLAERQKISRSFADFIINKINSLFPSAMSYVQKQQDGRVTSDYLGRTRDFDQPHKIRNFVVQSPAATICFEKLIALKQMVDNTDTDIGFHLHDGYCLYVPVKQTNYFTRKAIDTLESPSMMLPGLKLKIACKIGPNLNFE